MAGNVYQRYGGFAAVHKIVSAFYDKVLESDRLYAFFADADMHALIDHQTKFVASLMGGPAVYTNDALRRVHAELGITPGDFDETVELLRQSLEEFDLAPQDVDHVCDEFRQREPYIVSAAA